MAQTHVMATTEIPYLRVLVCSGNLGNAEPDVKSLEMWVPEDGSCQQVLEDQKYPLLVNNKGKVDYSHGDASHFDLIVLGLQESTFIPKGFTLDLMGNAKKEEEEGEEETEVDFPFSVEHAAAGKGNSTSTYISDPTESIPSKIATAVSNLAAQTTVQAAKARDILVANSTSVLHKMLQNRLPSYTRHLSVQRGEMRLLIYSRTRKDNNHTVSIKSVRVQNTGTAGLPNKGGIVGQVQVNGTTTLAFVSCHLEAHEGLKKYKRRCSTMGDILRGTTSTPYPDVSLASHYCFVLGDLNFRTRYNGHIHVQEQLEQVQELIETKQWKELNEADELCKALASHECLFGFRTAFCNFPPTFKVERDTQGFVYQTKRTPSYTDRILWRTGNLLNKNIKPLCYEPIDDFTTSDHKPIRGAFDIQLNPTHFTVSECHRKASLLHHFHLRRSQASRDMINSANARLHIFVSDLQCDIFPMDDTGQSISSMDSHICVISSPAKLLLPSRSSWEKVTRAWNNLRGQVNARGDDDDVMRWPHTSVAKNTLNPSWGDEEIHCFLQEKDKHGQPNNVGGAVLHIFAMESPDESVIGSFAINLEYLYRLCHGGDSEWLQSSGIDELLESTVDHGMTLHKSTGHSNWCHWISTGHS